MPISPTTTALEDAQALIVGEGLPFPWLPPDLACGLRRLGDLVYGTRTDMELGPYHLAIFTGELLRGRAADYVLFGFDGHGMSSWAFHYYLVRGPLALFVQLPWGGAFIEVEPARAAIAAALARVEPLCQRLADARQQGRLAPAAQLLVIDSRFEAPECAWRDESNPEGRSFRRPGAPILVQALDAVTARLAGNDSP